MSKKTSIYRIKNAKEDCYYMDETTFTEDGVVFHTFEHAINAVKTFSKKTGVPLDELRIIQCILLEECEIRVEKPTTRENPLTLPATSYWYYSL